MRILHWVDCYPPYRGGTETVVARLAAAQVARGACVAVVTGTHEGTPDEEVRDGVSIHRFAFRQALEQHDPRSVLSLIRAVAALKRSFAPDVVHLHFLGASGFFHLRTMQACPAPMLVTIHGGLGDCRGGARTVLGDLLRKSDWVTGVSAAMLAEAVAAEPCVASRGSVVFNGDASEPSFLPAAEPPYLFCSGRHVATKGMDLAIAAMACLAPVHPDLRLIVAGDGPLRSELESQAAELGLNGSAAFTGWMSEIDRRELIARAFAVLVPSRSHEGFGLVALEAALLSRPVICSAVGGLPEVVRDGETGIVLDQPTPDAIAQAVVRLLDDRETAERLGRQAARQAVARFGLERQTDTFFALYAKIAGGR